MIELLVLLGLILAGFSLAIVCFPQMAWRSSEGWKFANAEPSQAVLMAYRFLGLIGVVGGVAMLWYAWMQR